MNGAMIVIKRVCRIKGNQKKSMLILMLMTNVTSHPKDSLWDCVVTRAKCLKWQELRFHRWNAPLLSSNGEDKCFFNYWKIIWLRACFWEPLLAGYRKSMFGGWLALATYLGDLPAIDPGYSPIVIQYAEKTSQNAVLWTAALQILKYGLFLLYYLLPRNVILSSLDHLLLQT